MGKEFELPKLQIRWSGAFEFQELLNESRSYLKKRAFFVREPTYKHKGGGEGKDVELEIAAARRESGYVKESLTILIRITNMKDIEMVKEGEKKKMQQGIILLEISGKIELDYEDRFGGSKSARFLYQTHLQARTGEQMDSESVQDYV